MISLQPREQFMIVRLLDNHTDSGTYYVRAVIRNSVTGAILDTVNLTDAGNRRFYYLYEVPSDISGQGFYIDITITVYTNSIYTTKASAYGEELEQYLVFDRMPKGGGGGGGAEVDYKKIEKILRETMKPLIERKEINLDPVLAQIKGVFKAIDAIEIPKIPEIPGNGEVLTRLAEVEKVIVKEIVNKEVTEKTDLGEISDKIEKVLAKETDLGPVLEKIETAKEEITEAIESSSENENTAHSRLKKIGEVVGPILANDFKEPEPKKLTAQERAKKLMD